MIPSILTLAFTIVSVHLVFIGYIRPEAELAIELARQAGQSSPRVLEVILKDYEQEICIILMIWGVFLIVGKCLTILKERYLFKVDLLESSVAEDNNLTSILSSLDSLPNKIKHTPLVRILMSSIRRFLITNDVQNTSDAIDSSIEALAIKQEAENSMIRYLIWAIPSIGFIGTVRGLSLIHI